MAYDNICKMLAEDDPLAFARWFFGSPIQTVEMLKTELSVEPIRADSIVFMRVENTILHLEFQTQYESNPPLPLRMLDYFVRLYRKYRLPVRQGVFLLCKPPANTVIEEAFQLGETIHRYRVVKLWEESPETFLSEPTLLPLATLTRTTQPEQLLAQVVRAMSAVENRDQRLNLLACGKVLGGLRFEENLLDLWMKEDLVRESVIYQRLLREGEAKGKVEGEAKGKLEGKLEVAQNGLRLGMTPETVATLTGMSLAAVEQLQQELG